MARRKTAVAEKKYISLVDFYDQDGSVILKGQDYDSEDEAWIEKLVGTENSTGKPIIELKK